MAKSWNLDAVRRAWDDIDRQRRRASEPTSEPTPYTYVEEVWTDHVVVNVEGPGQPRWVSVDYTVGDDGKVTFSDPKPVEKRFVALTSQELLWKEGPTDKLVRLTSRIRESAILQLAGIERVGGYKRKSKSGKMVSVSQYTRSPGDMSPEEILAEIEKLTKTSDGADRIENARRRTRIVALEREQAKRIREEKVPTAPQPGVPGGVTPPPQGNAQATAMIDGPGKPFDQKEYQNRTGADNMADEGNPSNMAKSAVASVDSLLEDLKDEEGDNGPKGWNSELDNVNSMANDIREKIKKGDYAKNPAKLKDDLEDLAQEINDNVSTTNDDRVKEVTSELLEAADVAGSSPESRIAQIRDRRKSVKGGKNEKAAAGKSGLTVEGDPKKDIMVPVKDSSGSEVATIGYTPREGWNVETEDGELISGDSKEEVLADLQKYLSGGAGKNDGAGKSGKATEPDVMGDLNALTKAVEGIEDDEEAQDIEDMIDRLAEFEFEDFSKPEAVEGYEEARQEVLDAFTDAGFDPPDLGGFDDQLKGGKNDPRSAGLIPDEDDPDIKKFRESEKKPYDPEPGVVDKGPYVPPSKRGEPGVSDGSPEAKPGKPKDVSGPAPKGVTDAEWGALTAGQKRIFKGYTEDLGYDPKKALGKINAGKAENPAVKALSPAQKKAYAAYIAQGLSPAQALQEAKKSK